VSHHDVMLDRLAWEFGISGCGVEGPGSSFEVDLPHASQRVIMTSCETGWLGVGVVGSEHSSVKFFEVDLPHASQ
jgi:hypothetical protein